MFKNFLHKDASEPLIFVSGKENHGEGEVCEIEYVIHGGLMKG